MGPLLTRARKTKARISGFLSWRERCYRAERRAKELAVEADLARAQLCQLRVAQENVRKRVGYMVSAFIPEGVLEKLDTPERAQEFKRHIVDALVTNALKGLHRRTEKGKLTAMIFVPLGKFDPYTRLEVFERDGKVTMDGEQALAKEVEKYKRERDPRYFLS